MTLREKLREWLAEPKPTEDPDLKLLLDWIGAVKQQESRLSKIEREIGEFVSRSNRLQADLLNHELEMAKLVKRKHGSTVRRVRDICAQRGLVAHFANPRKKPK